VTDAEGTIRRNPVGTMHPGACALGICEVRLRAFTTEHGHVALHWTSGVIHEYQSDSLSKRPLAFVTRNSLLSSTGSGMSMKARD
jgi:hypothetical protein